MKTTLHLISTVVAVCVTAALLSTPPAMGAAITDFDSTQPRGAPPGTNAQGQLLNPVEEGFRAPAFQRQFDTEIYRDWAGNLMANAMRDPGFMATHSVGIQDFINFVNTIPGDPADPASPIHQFLTTLKLQNDITHRDASGRLQPEHLLPATADWCLRCHAPAGWLEGRSEPPTTAFPFLKGQFWGGAFQEFPGHLAPFPFNPVNYWAGNPLLVDLSKESEREMDGVQCDVCHRIYDNFKRTSGFDGSAIPNGNGGLFVAQTNIFGNGSADEAFGILGQGRFCGTCHDVTNPLIKTKTPVNGTVPDMFHPVERTFTEWYWSAHRTSNTTCQKCHAPMKFRGAQSWMVSPGLNKLWGTLDETFTNPPYDYNVPASRRAIYRNTKDDNLDFMTTAATVTLEGVPAAITPGQDVTVNVKVVNNTGHKLPTGYGEGRQMWIHIAATDGTGQVIYEDGVLSSGGRLIRTPDTKVYEIIALAEGYENAILDGFNILDFNKDGKVTAKEKEFHFVLMNFIEKDNRIPPLGYNKAAFMADGAFIVPHDPKDVDYPDGQNWDVTPYTIPIPQGVTGPVTITATLRYQTFSKQYVDFLRVHDSEPTLQNGGRMRNIPDGPLTKFHTWGQVNSAVWFAGGKGKPVEIGTATADIQVQ